MVGGKLAPLTIMNNEDAHMDSMITTFNTAVTERASEIFGKHCQKKKSWVTAEILHLWDKRKEVRKKSQNLKDLRNTRKWRKHIKRCMERAKKTGQENSVVRLKKIWGRTKIRGHTNSRKAWPLWNKGKLLLSKIAQENASQRNETYWTDGQNTALSCMITRPMEIH